MPGARRCFSCWGAGYRPWKEPRDCRFLAWFGPLGLAALLYVLHAERLTGDHRYWDFASFVTVASILAHGVTATPGTRWYGRSDSPE